MYTTVYRKLWSITEYIHRSTPIFFMKFNRSIFLVHSASCHTSDSGAIPSSLLRLFKRESNFIASGAKGITLTDIMARAFGKSLQ